jgi:hypothetical protein
MSASETFNQFKQLYDQAIAHQTQVSNLAQNAQNMGLTGGVGYSKSGASRADTSGDANVKTHKLPPKLKLMHSIIKENLKPHHASEPEFAHFRQQDWIKLASIIIDKAGDMESTKEINSTVIATSRKIADGDLSVYLEQLKQFNKENKKEPKIKSKSSKTGNRYAIVNKYGVKGGSFY